MCRRSNPPKRTGRLLSFCVTQRPRPTSRRTVRRKRPSPPKMPVKKSSNGVLSPGLSLHGLNLREFMALVIRRHDHQHVVNTTLENAFCRECADQPGRLEQGDAYALTEFYGGRRRSR